MVMGLTRLPEGSTAWLDRTHAPRGAALALTRRTWSGPKANVSTLASVIATVDRVGERRWGRTRMGIAIWVATKITSVTAMAGSGRRISSPAVAPRARANAA